MKLGHSIEDSRTKYPELTDDKLDELQNWASKRGLPQIPLEQLALFAHSCDFDLERAKKCMAVYYKMRATVPEFFADRNPRSDHLQHSLKVLQFVGLPLPDRQGNRIIFHRLSDTQPSQYVFNDGIKLLMMSIDASLYTEGCCPGYVFLFDMRGVGLRHLTRLSLNSIRKFFEYLQEGLPVRLKGIHVLNAVWFMDKILSLIRPFMKKELFEMLHLYTGDVSEVYESISPTCLPSDYGGNLESLEKLHELHCEKLYQLKDYFLEEQSLHRNDSSHAINKSCDYIPVQEVSEESPKIYVNNNDNT